MGIRFFCPNGHKLHVKAFLAGKRGKCPKCGTKLKIPETDSSDLAATETDPAAVWYVRLSSGDQYGPAQEAVVRGWIAEGRVTGDSLVWKEGWAQWEPLSAIEPQEKQTASRTPSPPPVGSPIESPASVGVLPDEAVKPTIDPHAPSPKISKKKQLKQTKLLVVSMGIICIVLSGLLIWVLAR